MASHISRLSARAAHAFLAGAPTVSAMAQIDDLTDDVNPINVPTTLDEAPNWRRRLSNTLEELAVLPWFIDIAGIFRAERQSRAPRWRERVCLIPVYL